MTPYEFGRFIKLATQPVSFAPSTGLPAKKPGPSAYEKNWQPKQQSYGGRTQLIPPMTPDMAAPGRSGGTYRPAIGKPVRNRVHGRPQNTEQLRLSPEGEAEIYNPQAAYDARPNDT